MGPCDETRYGNLENKLRSMQWERRRKLNAIFRIVTLGLFRNVIKA